MFKIHFLEGRDSWTIEAETFIVTNIGTHVFLDGSGKPVAALGHVNFDRIEKIAKEMNDA